MTPQSLARRAGATPTLLAGALATALAAQISLPIPGSPVPQSLQTLAVVVVGGALGAGRGGLAMLLYLGMGAAGLPMFADGTSGVGRLWGPTGGYLGGFVLGAVLAGWWVGRPRGRAWGRTFLGLAAGMVAAHLVILGMGWGRLALLVGGRDAFAQGVAPFLWGGTVKSLAAAGILWFWLRAGPGRRAGDPGAPGASEPVEPGSSPV